jgi:hypothetical protein
VPLGGLQNSKLMLRRKSVQENTPLPLIPPIKVEV